MTHKIAIIKSRDITVYDEYGEHNKNDYRRIIDSITDWEEVSDEDFKLLKVAAPRFDFEIIERVTDETSFIAKTVSAYKAIAKAEQERIEKDKKAREQAAYDRKIKKDMNDKEAKLKLFKKLQAELGDEAKI